MLIIRFRLAQIVILMMSLAIFFSYGLQFYVPIELLLPPLKARVSEQWQLTAEFVLRYSIVLFFFKLINHTCIHFLYFGCSIGFSFSRDFDDL